MLTTNQQEFLKSLLTRARLRSPLTPQTKTYLTRSVDDQLSGPGPDVRDPATISKLVDNLIVSRGWDLDLVAGKVSALWPDIVGEAIADHVMVEIVKFDKSGTSGTLVLRAESTAWATQMKLCLPVVQENLDQEFGAGIFTDIQILGPTAPSWKYGKRSVAGRGPRDTYG